MTEPVSLDEARRQVRVTESYDDDFLAGCITEARDYCEMHTGRTLAEATFRLVSSSFADCMPLAVPLLSVQSVSYFDTDNTEQTLDPSFYYVADYGIELQPGQSWPDVYERKDAVMIEFTAGACPPSARRAILLLVAHYYENREAVNVYANTKPLELAVSSLLHELRRPLPI